MYLLSYVTDIGHVKLSRYHVSRPTFDEELHGDLPFNSFYRLRVELK
jgi:hypothetical protein